MNIKNLIHIPSTRDQLAFNDLIDHIIGLREAECPNDKMVAYLYNYYSYPLAEYPTQSRFMINSLIPDINQEDLTKIITR